MLLLLLSFVALDAAAVVAVAAATLSFVAVDVKGAGQQI
jgi:hypothetical protein